MIKMGVQITELLNPKTITIADLKGKRIVVDAYNQLYQFLTTIRQPDGSPLTDDNGNITSHLVGLFNRTTKLMSCGINLAFVFDGTAPDLKKKERERRKALKVEAAKKYEVAVKEEDIDSMKKYASRTARLTPEMVDEAKKLLDALGVPYIVAPSEGEAQAAHMVKNSDFFALSSQDTDALIFGAERLVKNLSILGKRKKTNKLEYSTVKPELIELSETINQLGIGHEQLILLAMLVGTDYNIGGIKGVGPKNGLKLVKQFHHDPEALFRHVKWEDFFQFPWTDVYYTITKMPVTDDYDLKWGGIDVEKLNELLVEKHNFNKERIETQIQKLIKQTKQKSQKGLGDFF